MLPEWIHALWATGAFTAGVAIAVRTVLSISRDVASRSRHEAVERAAMARTGEINAAITQDAWDAMLYRLGQAEKLVAQMRGEIESRDSLIAQLLDDVRDLRSVVATGRGTVPPVRIHESMRPAMEPAAKRSNGDDR
jgi:hypothetical protein